MEGSWMVQGKLSAMGSILGKKYGTQTNFGEWDERFTMEDLDMFIKKNTIVF